MDTREKMQELEESGHVFILAYDFNGNHSGIKRVVEAVNRKLQTTKVDELIPAIIQAPDGGKREKTRYVLVAIPADYIYVKDGLKRLDFIHRGMGYEDEPFIEYKLAKVIKEILKRLSLAPVEVKMAGVQIVGSEDIEDEYLTQIV